MWCPLGDDSDPIPFNRSEAALENEEEGGDVLVRSPINHATSFLDLDFLYGRSEREASALRTLEGGLMNVSDSGVPFQNEDGSWKVTFLQ